MNVCMCVRYVWMYGCMYACMHVCMCACMHVCMYVRVYVCTYEWTFLNVFACVVVRAYVGMYACLSIYVCVYTHKCLRQWRGEGWFRVSGAPQQHGSHIGERCPALSSTSWMMRVPPRTDSATGNSPYFCHDRRIAAERWIWQHRESWVFVCLGNKFSMCGS